MDVNKKVNIVFVLFFLWLLIKLECIGVLFRFFMIVKEYFLFRCLSMWGGCGLCWFKFVFYKLGLVLGLLFIFNN